MKIAVTIAKKSIKLVFFTVFDETEIKFCPGVNVILDKNGMGKTHLLKLLYMVHLIRTENSCNFSDVFRDN